MSILQRVFKHCILTYNSEIIPLKMMVLSKKNVLMTLLPTHSSPLKQRLMYKPCCLWKGHTLMLFSLLWLGEMFLNKKKVLEMCSAVFFFLNVHRLKWLHVLCSIPLDSVLILNKRHYSLNIFRILVNKWGWSTLNILTFTIKWHGALSP